MRRMCEKRFSAARVGGRAGVPEEFLEFANREEFDGDDDAGVYNPVVLPWKNR